jgi:hypothetical protein
MGHGVAVTEVGNRSQQLLLSGGWLAPTASGSDLRRPRGGGAPPPPPTTPTHGPSATTEAR